MTKEILTQERLKELLHYNPDTGVFVWKVPRQKINVGDIAGFNESGYTKIGINSEYYFAHRLAFLYMNGSFPKEHTDHINHVKNDNRFSNLRACTCQENQKNAGIRVDNKSGTSGVFWEAALNKWRASIRHDGKQKYLGMFKEKNHAIIARWLAEDEYNYHENHGKKTEEAV